ncbi:hypothetical protein FRC12_024779 [Ceratobasidium sp. 428]|nr:hypothetical protein FRC12_024779 [Ceratobasidium sp. 428]
MVSRDNSDSDPWLQFLDKSGLTTAEGLYAEFFKTDEADQVKQYLKCDDKYTILVPNNEAFGYDKPSVDPDTGSRFLYNTIIGDVPSGPPTTSRRADKSESRGVHSSGYNFPQRPSSKHKRWGLIEGRQVQVIDRQFSSSRKRWSDDSIFINQAVGSANVEKIYQYKSCKVFAIDLVNALPPRISDLLCKPLIDTTPNGFVEFGGKLQKAGLLDSLDDKYTERTVFAPTDDAFNKAGGIPDDRLQAILENHIITGTLAYSTNFDDIHKATADSGNDIYLMTENGVKYVKCGNQEAVVQRSDVTSEHGVLHVIDTVLECNK